MKVQNHLERIRDGDADSYEPLVKKYQSPIYRLCLSQVRHPNVAEEIAQETFIKAFQSIDTLKDPTKFYSWLKRTAVNSCRDYLKSRRFHFVTLNEELSIDGLSLEEPFTESLDAMESEVIENELYSRLYSLDLEKRNVLFLYYIYELPSKGIAERLGISQSAVKKRLERARTALKEVIEMSERAHPDNNFSRKVIELIKRPNLIEKPDNPVANIWKEIRAFLKDHKMIEGEELVSKEDHEFLLPGDFSNVVEVDKERVLRSHTTTVVIDYLKSHPNESCKVACVGRAWRDYAEDNNHLQMFHQMDVLWMGEDVREGDLLTIFNNFMETILPKYRWTMEKRVFPFVKRGYAINVDYKGARLEVAGAGEFKEDVLRDCGVDPEKYVAIGYGMGIERLAMIKYGIDTIQDVAVLGR